MDVLCGDVLVHIVRDLSLEDANALAATCKYLWAFRHRFRQVCEEKFVDLCPHSDMLVKNHLGVWQKSNREDEWIDLYKVPNRYRRPGVDTIDTLLRFDHRMTPSIQGRFRVVRLGPDDWFSFEKHGRFVKLVGSKVVTLWINDRELVRLKSDTHDLSPIFAGNQTRFRFVGESDFCWVSYVEEEDIRKQIHTMTKMTTLDRATEIASGTVKYGSALSVARVVVHDPVEGGKLVVTDLDGKETVLPYCYCNAIGDAVEWTFRIGNANPLPVTRIETVPSSKMTVWDTIYIPYT